MKGVVLETPSCILRPIWNTEQVIISLGTLRNYYINSKYYKEYSIYCSR
jgi:hypothetical protein